MSVCLSNLICEIVSFCRILCDDWKWVFEIMNVFALCKAIRTGRFDGIGIGYMRVVLRSNYGQKLKNTEFFTLSYHWSKIIWFVKKTSLTAFADLNDVIECAIRLLLVKDEE